MVVSRGVPGGWLRLHMRSETERLYRTSLSWKLTFIFTKLR